MTLYEVSSLGCFAGVARDAPRAEWLRALDELGGLMSSRPLARHCLFDPDFLRIAGCRRSGGFFGKFGKCSTPHEAGRNREIRIRQRQWRRQWARTHQAAQAHQCSQHFDPAAHRDTPAKTGRRRTRRAVMKINRASPLPGRRRQLTSALAGHSQSEEYPRRR